LGYGEAQMLDKLLYEEEVKRCCACFEQQFHYGVFYAYMKLREQEIRNIMWVSECVAQVRHVAARTSCNWAVG
jgi:V-type H+-transporting ATPase subunit d